MHNIKFILISIILTIIMTKPLYSQQKAEKNIVQNYKERLTKLLEPGFSQYNPEGKSDPFIPFIRQQLANMQALAEDDRPTRCKTPIECLDIGQLQLVAIVTMNQGYRLAMVQDATTKGYVITEGMRIGYRDGIVKEIQQNAVIIEETTKDIFGNPIKTEKKLLLNPEETR